MFRSRPQRGQNLVEFALVLSLLLTVSLGLADFGRVFFAHVGLTNAAREGARLAAVLPTCPATGTHLAAIRSRVTAEQPGLAILDSSIVVSCPPAGRRVTIQSYPFQLISPFTGRMLGVSGLTLPLTTQATMPVMK